MLQELVAARQLPPVLLPGTTAADWPRRRAELLTLLAQEEYGIAPPAPAAVHVEVVEENANAWAGKALHRRVMLTVETPRGPFAFPVDLVVPHAGRPVPFLVHIAFYPYPGGVYMPVEEIVDSGYGVASFDYNDVTRDCEDEFSSGLAACFPREGDTAPGKIALWAWAASRVLDVVLTLEGVDAKRVAVVGHSRLGKTALWAATQDERFAAAFSNESGCSGAAITRGKQGEHISHITSVFPYWFCQRYAAYRDRESEMPFDQHTLLALLAPRPVCVASAAADLWADPESEFLACVAASPVWELLGQPGLVHGDALPQPGDHLYEGSVGYHLRAGTHFFSRQDWQGFMAFLRRQLPAEEQD